MQEIDSMDMLGFLRVRAWNAQQKKEKQKPSWASCVGRSLSL